MGYDNGFETLLNVFGRYNEKTQTAKILQILTHAIPESRRFLGDLPEGEFLKGNDITCFTLRSVNCYSNYS